MRRDELEHIIRAAGAIIGDRHLIISGQPIHPGAISGKFAILGHIFCRS